MVERAMDPVANPRRIFRLYVELADIAPPIWRELEVAGELTLFELHTVLQRAFGWQSYHLWCFDIDGLSYGEADEDLDFEDPERTLDMVLSKPGARFSYRYDFGDDWVHEVVVRSIETKVGRDAVCLGGARAGPPEDCGGPPGYSRLVEVLSDPSRPEHMKLKRWCGHYDPDAFDRAAINASLAEAWDDPVERLEEEIDMLLELLDEEHLPNAVREEIEERGARLVPALLEILTDPDLYDTEAPGGGWAPIHAVKLLVDLGATQAVDPMLDVLENTAWMDILHDRIILELPRLGAPVVEPALQRLPDADPDDRRCLLEILAGSGVRDDRIYRHLVEYLDEDPEMGAGHLAVYGDPAALPHLNKHYDALSPNLEAWRSLIELADAIEVLGGRLTEAQQHKLDLGRSLHQSRFAPAPPIRTKKIGRNEPCHCGSGKKYKHCHLKADKDRPVLH